MLKKQVVKLTCMNICKLRLIFYCNVLHTIDRAHQILKAVFLNMFYLKNLFNKITRY